MSGRIPIWKKRPAYWPFVLRLSLLSVATFLFVFAARKLADIPRFVSILLPVFNLLPDLTGYFFAMAGVALLFMPDDLKKLEDYRRTRLVIAALIFLVGLGAVISNSAQKTADRKESDSKSQKLTDQVTSLIGQQTVLVAQVKNLTEQGLPQLAKDLKPTPKPVVLPDLHLQLVYPISVSVFITNDPKAKVAEKPKYQFLLADLDNLDGNILPIPATEGDFIRPGEGWGPNAMMELPAVKAVVHPGDRVFGYGIILCPQCIKTRSYWVFIEQGKGGWYCEMPKPLYPTGRQFFDDMKAHFDAYLNELAPVGCRVSIGDRR
jgi:hypothetical protein